MPTPTERCSNCSDPISEVGRGAPVGDMCQRCALCWYCDEPATHWQEATDKAHCDDCWLDVTTAERKRRNEELAQMCSND